VKGENNKDIPLECLSFDRDKEMFTNVEKDWVKIYYPDLKCGWAYACQVIDPLDGKLRVLNLKKKLLEQILEAAKDLGNPTDPVNGWDVYFKKVKTGSQVFNVEYQLQALKCKKRALNEPEMATLAAIKPIDDLLPRPTPDAQHELLERVRNKPVAEAAAEALPSDVESELDL
jgi:hypothetical protein